MYISVIDEQHCRILLILCLITKTITKITISGAVMLIINGNHIIVEVKISRSSGY